MTRLPGGTSLGTAPGMERFSGVGRESFPQTSTAGKRASLLAKLCDLGAVTELLLEISLRGGRQGTRTDLQML
jgi:hypothetical protein